MLHLEEALLETFDAEIGKLPDATAAPMRRVLFPTDFSPSSLRALAYAEEIARRFDAELLLLYVDFAPSVYDPSRDDVASSKHALERAAERLCTRGVRARPVYRRGAASDEIVRAAASEGADVIVMGTHGRTGLTHALMGSVAEHVVRQAGCPVMTVRTASS